MSSEARTLRFAMLAAAALLIAGCASQGATGTAAGEVRATAARAPATARAPERDAARDTAPPAQNDSGDDATALQDDDALASMLAERRRSDYPAIELAEAGFTITEQTRVASDARSDYDQALGLLRQDRLAEGIALLESVTATTPELTAPYIDLGIAYSRIGDLKHAEATLETAALLSPEHPIVHNELGILYRRLGRFAEARASYEKALAVFAGFHFARRNLAVLCDLYLADPTCALENYRAYLDSVGSDPEVEIWIADIENRVANQGG